MALYNKDESFKLLNFLQNDEIHYIEITDNNDIIIRGTTTRINDKYNETIKVVFNNDGDVKSVIILGEDKISSGENGS